MFTSYAEPQPSTRLRPHAGIVPSVQPLPTSAITFPLFTGQIKHCAVASLPLLFSSFPCTLTSSSILARPSQREAKPHVPLGSLDTLLLMDLMAENYERLLNWLHPNRDDAETEYQRIRKLLVRYFQNQDCSNPEHLADATIDRAAEKLTIEKIQKWVGPKDPYFYRVGFNIFREYKRKGFPEVQIPDGFQITEPLELEDFELTWQCFEKCLEQQPIDRRELVVRYYRGTKAIKIRNRAELARERRLTLAALRVQADRIRQKLRTCIERCLDDAAHQGKPSLRM